MTEVFELVFGFGTENNNAQIKQGLITSYYNYTKINWLWDLDHCSCGMILKIFENVFNKVSTTSKIIKNST